MSKRLQTSPGALGWDNGQAGPQWHAPLFDLGGMGYNVRNSKYGATGGGTVDDSAAFTSAANDAHFAPGGAGMVIVPPGTYLIGTALPVYSNVTYYLVGATITGAQAATVAPALNFDSGGNLVAKSLTVLASGPYTPTALAGGADFSAAIRIKGGKPWVDPTHPTYGAKWDGQQVTDGVTTASSGVLTSASGKFAAGDVGKLICVTRGGISLANPTVAISGADGGAGGTTLPTGTYTFGYTFVAYDGETTLGTSTANYTQLTAGHIITLTLPALPAGARATRVYCTVAPAGAFAGQLIETPNTSFAYTAGLTSTGTSASSTNTSGASYSTTIASFQSTTQVTLTANAVSSAVGATVTWFTDDQAALAAALTALVAIGRGTLKLPSGIGGASVGLTINAPYVNIEGDGQYSTWVFYTGSADAIRLQMSPFSNVTWPGRLKGFTVDGTGAAAGASGFHLGDAVNLELNDVRASYFRGTGSKGFWLDNRTNWFERSHWLKVNGYHNTTNWLWDVNGGTISFDHTMLVDITQDIEGTGFALQNGATLGYGMLNMTCNVNGGATVIDIRDTSVLGFQNLPMLCSISAETAGIATGLKVATGAALYGAGTIDFGAGPFTSSDALAGFGNIIFIGRFNCPGIVAMGSSDGGVVMGGEKYFAPAGNYRYPITAGDTGLVGIDLISNGVTWHTDHRGSITGPNNWELAQGGAAPSLRVTTGGTVGALAQLYPGAEAGGQQATGGVLHSTGVPANGNGNNNDHVISDNGHRYFRSGGIWNDNWLNTVQAPTEAVLVSGVDVNLGAIVAPVALTAARLVGAPLHPVSGQRITFIILQDGTGGRAVTWNAVFKVSWSDTGNTLNKRSMISYVYDGTNWNQDGAQTPYI